eukprot:scaffold18116_cov123-Isochrysis_galbana.AAC.3
MGWPTGGVSGRRSHPGWSPCTAGVDPRNPGAARTRVTLKSSATTYATSPTADPPRSLVAGANGADGSRHGAVGMQIGSGDLGSTD